MGGGRVRRRCVYRLVDLGMSRRRYAVEYALIAMVIWLGLCLLRRSGTLDWFKPAFL